MNIGQTNPLKTSSYNSFVKFYLSKNYWVRWRRMILVVLFISAIILFGSFSFYLGAMAHRQHLIRNQFLLSIKEMINTNYHIPLNYIQSWFSVPEKIKIDMKFKHLQRMEFNRDSSLKKGAIAAAIKTVALPAELTFNNKKYDAKISLYGTFLDHVNSDQYSMRIKLKKGTIMGMRKFVLMNPKVRYGLYDWFIHKLMKFEDLIHLRYKFVGVSLNSEDKGIYILEELFDKELIGNNRQRDGLILVPSKRLKIYGEDKLLLDPSTVNSVYLVNKLFKSYREGVLHPKQLFDYQKMSRFLAAVKLVGGEHSLIFDNIRFFFNPITGRLEPIGREFNIKTNIDLNIFQDELYRNLLIDPEFVTLYVQNLLRLSQPEYLDNLFRKFDLELRKNEKFIHRQQPFHFLDKNYFYQHQKKINHELALGPENIQTFYTRKGNRLFFLFENSSDYPLKINSFFSTSKILDSLFTQALDSNTIISRGRTSIDSKIPSDNLEEITESLMKMEISLKIVGSNSEFNSLMIPSKNGQDGGISFDLMRKSPNPEEFPFLQLNEKHKEINIIPGHWTINKDMILPPEYIVKSFPGTQLNLKNGASIVSYSPLKFYGTETNPISIQSDDGIGRGIVVLNTGKSASKFYHVVFRNLSRPKGFGWSLTSAITFYESDVHFDKSRFLENHDSDDYLNIFRSDFSITRSKFSHSFADALDIDFSNGNITDVLFLECGSKDKNGDCFDISGSTLTLRRTRIDGAADKALSIGENSRVVASDISISHATVGVASKDSSEIKLDDLTISKCSFGFAAYQKKKEFGPAHIAATNFSSESIDTLHILEKGSSLILNETPIVQFSKKHPLERITGASIPLTRVRNASIETLKNF